MESYKFSILFIKEASWQTTGRRLKDFWCLWKSLIKGTHTRHWSSLPTLFTAPSTALFQISILIWKRLSTLLCRSCQLVLFFQIAWFYWSFQGMSKARGGFGECDTLGAVSWHYFDCIHLQKLESQWSELIFLMLANHIKPLKLNATAFKLINVHFKALFQYVYNQPHWNWDWNEG